MNGFINGKLCHFEHGHHIDGLSTNCEFVFYGHTHIAGFEKRDDVYYFNPGSITLPKNGGKRSYIIWDENVITLYDIEGNVLDSFTY